MPASFWKTDFIGYVTPSSVIVCHSADVDRHRTDEYGNLVARGIDATFYVWKPHFDRLYFGNAQIGHDDAGEEPLRAIDRAKAALLAVYPPDGNPPRTLTLKAVHRDVAKKCVSRGWKPPSEDRVADALGELGHRPSRNRK